MDVLKAKKIREAEHSRPVVEENTKQEHARKGYQEGKSAHR